MCHTQSPSLNLGRDRICLLCLSWMRVWVALTMEATFLSVASMFEKALSFKAISLGCVRDGCQGSVSTHENLIWCESTGTKPVVDVAQGQWECFNPIHACFGVNFPEFEDDLFAGCFGAAVGLWPVGL